MISIFAFGVSRLGSVFGVDGSGVGALTALALGSGSLGIEFLVFCIYPDLPKSLN